MIDRDIFEELFVLELANNHLGKVERGQKIISTFAQVVRFNNVRAAIKLQFRDVGQFIHKDFLDSSEIRYIKKTRDTQLSDEGYATLVKAIRQASCLPMATPFDEKSVDLCCELGIPILKIASSDLNDWFLIERIAKTKKPVIVSTGGSSVKDIDDLVTFFQNRHIPIAINHCVSIYPSEDRELEMNQIDFLRNRYPTLTVGFSTHEHADWSASMMIAYAKGARTFERHIDIEEDGIKPSPYCSTPQQVDMWFKAFHKAKEMCGAPGTQKRMPPAEGNRISRFAGSRGLRAPRSSRGTCAARSGCLPGYPAVAGTNLVPRIHARRGADDGGGQRWSGNDRRHREPLLQHSVAARFDLPPGITATEQAGHGIFLVSAPSLSGTVSREVEEPKKLVRAADFIFQRLSAKYGVRDIFLITGGGAMHLNDAIGRNESLRYICCHHEQACAMAAEVYARVKGSLGVIQVTTGPGAVNTLTGVLGAWLDSIPVLIISGQVRREVMASAGLRQLGDQEADVISMVRPITKYAALIDDPADVQYHLDQAIAMATSGRPGPVWLDIPLDVQGALIDPEQQRTWEPDPEPVLRDEQRSAIEEVAQRLRAAERPVLFVGHGIRLANGAAELLEMADRLRIPVVTSLLGMDLLPTDHAYAFGRVGSIGQRSANFIVQNSDFLLTLGTRLNLRMVTFNYRAFARAAYKVMVDVDAAELAKKTVKPDLALALDAKVFLRALGEMIPEPLAERAPWMEYCRRIRARYPNVPQEQNPDYVHSHVFVDRLSDFLPEDAVVVSGDGLASEATYHAYRVKRGQRVILNSGCAAMGFDLPAAVGASTAMRGTPVVCLAGDGSIMLNLQELQTIRHNGFPVKIFLFENGGYLSIRRTQETYFGSKYVGSGPSSGVSSPDFAAVAAAFGLPCFSAQTNGELDQMIAEVLKVEGPAMGILHLDPSEPLIPKLVSRRLPDGTMVSPPLEDMWPFLDREEFAENMLIEPVSEAPMNEQSVLASTDRCHTAGQLEFTSNTIAPLHADCPQHRVRFAECMGSPPFDRQVFTIWQCQTCGLGFTDPVPTPETAHLLYETRESNDFQPGDTGIVARLKQLSASARRAECLPWVEFSTARQDAGLQLRQWSLCPSVAVCIPGRGGLPGSDTRPRPAAGHDPSLSR